MSKLAEEKYLTLFQTSYSINVAIDEIINFESNFQTIAIVSLKLAIII